MAVNFQKMILHPIAKINIGLNVISKREDGFHDISTLFYPVNNLHDELIIERSDVFSFTGKINWPVEKELCVRAFRLMQEKYGIGNVSISLNKSIPVGAGLGGGSSDAAYTIKGLNELFALGLSDEEMIEVAGQIGSDCPFFIRGTAQWGEGRGDKLSSSSVNLDDYKIVVRIPEGVSVNTAQAYAKIIPQHRSPSIREVVTTRMVEDWKKCLLNDFEPTVFSEYPQIEALKKEMYDEGALYASMSGSGAAVFGIFDKH